jgi:hypothetical protein
MSQGFTTPGCAIDMLIKFRESCFQISFVKIPTTKVLNKSKCILDFRFFKVATLRLDDSFALLAFSQPTS